MTTIVPHSELLTRAVKWVDEALTEQPEKKMAALIDEACMRYNLSPVDNEALIRLFSDARPEFSAQKADRVPETSQS